MAAKESSPSRQSFQEAMELVTLPSADRHGKVKRYFGTRAAWLPGQDLVQNIGVSNFRAIVSRTPRAAFGGHAYCQAGLAACRALAEEERRQGVGDGERLDLHTIHGYFTASGLSDRPFIYETQPLATSRLFTSYQVTARQPSTPSSVVDRFPAGDADSPLGPVCITATLSFKLPEPHSGGADAQEPPPQQRFAAILASRPPSEWPPSPPIDIDAIVEAVGRDIVGSFPAVEMYKVDMAAFNAGRPVHECRELLLYRLLRPLPSGTGGGVEGQELGPNAHILVHAFEADRNGLLMALNHLGFGHAYGRIASLSYSFVVHVNAREAVMDVSKSLRGERTDGWWVQEVSFPRIGAGRAIVMSTIWSPDGVHVATGYQDGLCRRREDRGGREGEGMGQENGKERL